MVARFTEEFVDHLLAEYQGTVPDSGDQRHFISLGPGITKMGARTMLGKVIQKLHVRLQRQAAITGHFALRKHPKFAEQRGSRNDDDTLFRHAEPGQDSAKEFGRIFDVDRAMPLQYRENQTRLLTGFQGEWQPRKKIADLVAEMPRA